MKYVWYFLGGMIVVNFLVGAVSSPSMEPEDYMIRQMYQDYSNQADVIDTTSRASCHSSYSGCLNPNASDYDCAGGSGNGPYYTGPVRVIGPDVFGLDRDNDGWGCE